MNYQIHRGTSWISALIIILTLFCSIVAEAAPFLSDDFNPATLEPSPAPAWRFYDPYDTNTTVGDEAGESTLTLDGTNALISIPEGLSHNLWITPDNKAPRYLQATDNADFKIEVKFETNPSLSNQSQGIIVQQDNDTFLRFDIFYGNTTKLFVAYIDGGSFVPHLPITTIQNSPKYQQVERVGDLWTFRYSDDGAVWTDAVTFTETNIAVTEVGFFAGTSGSNPDFLSSVDYFMNLDSPIPDTDTWMAPAPVITSWYGYNQPSSGPFGKPGTPQKWANILGNVFSGTNLDTLTYKLNFGPEQSLRFGPDTRRLLGVGDFNIEIDPTDLDDGSNFVEIEATDVNGLVTTDTVNINYSMGNLWRFPYTADWQSISDIQDIETLAHIVDGKWTLTTDGIKSLQNGYDRTIAIGDETWSSNYEVTVPFTLHKTSFNGVGFGMGWQGHEGSQSPKIAWPVQAIAWVRGPHTNPHLEIIKYDELTLGEEEIVSVPIPALIKDQLYQLKASSEPLNDGSGLSKVSVKFWLDSAGEPSTWNISGNVPTRDGSVLLVAWFADTTFGNVSIMPVSGDTVPPFISNIQVSQAETTATITWDTNESANSLVEYGLTNSYGTSNSNPGLVTAHSVNLTGLTSAMTYHFKVSSTDNGTNTGSSLDQTFTTNSMNNVAPTVDAGADQTITLPANIITLDGTVSDDGQPSPPAVTTLWTVASGPGAVNFNDAADVGTMANFGQEGTYELNLAANDGDLTTNDQITVIVNAAGGGNVAPTVDAGVDQMITLPNDATLDGTISDDGEPNPPGAVTTSWTVVSGPGTVTFTDDTQVDTTASFSLEGTYELNLAANDGALTTNDQIIIIVNVAGGSGDLLGHWTLDDGSGGIASDSSSNGNDGTVNGAIWSTNGIVNGALDFDGSNDYVDLGTLDIPGDKMTISAWVNADTFSHLGGRDARIVSKATGTSAAAHYWMLSTIKSGSSTVLRYRLKTNASTKTLIASTALTTNTWIHVAAVYDGSQMRLYQDGVEVGSTGNTGTIDQNAAVSAWIGQNPDGNRPFDGLIDDVQIHSRALSAAEIAALASGGGSGNVAPTVDAGVDQTIVLPADATLDGTVSDDGEPNPPGAVTTLWTMMSGPGTVTFGDDTAVDTTASFSVDGVYVLNLAADDSDLTSNVQLTVTVNAAGGGNVAPTVDAGVDQTIVLPADATLDGTVSDDGEPNPPGAVTTSWTVVSGPGTVTFTDDTQVDTTASFSLEGTYELNLAANDSDLTTNDQITVIVNAGGGSNIAPAVDAGVDQMITLPNDATLDGTISDDGEPNPPGAVTTSWTVVSGPGTVTFTDDTQVDTTASFSLEGTYELNLAANDGALTTNDQIIIIVNVAGGSGDLLGHWTLDDGSGGIASDSSSNGNDGTVNGAIWSTNGIVNGALDFDGSNDYVDLGTLDIPGDKMTISAWVNADTFSHLGGRDARIVSKATGTSAAAHYWMLSTIKSGSSTVLRYRLKTNASTKTLIATSAVLTTGTWIHVAAVYDGSQMRLYQDGVEVGSTGNTGTIDQNAAVSAWIGQNPDGNRPFDGLIDDVQIHSRALSAAEIAALASGGGSGNVAPTVDAGVDQTIVLPADATLDGTVSDDGEPNPPGAVTTLWTMMSGPGTVTFGDDTAVDTTASFSVDGVYVLNLAADDSDLTSNVQLTVTVNAAGGGNVAPTVDAGVDQTIVLPADATLDGTVSDDGEPNPPGAVTTSWTVVSGPGTVTFTDDTQVDTTASFSLEGTYELNLAANDSDLTTNDQITVIVNAGGGSNIAPAVDAGVDQMITLPNDATLDGTISDDGEPNPPGAVTTSWTVVSGPGTVTFTDDTQVDTTASFSLEGTYELNLAANDGALTTNDQIIIIVNVAGGSGDLLGHWTLDDGSGGIASDSSSNGNDGTVNGAIWSTNGIVNGALDFDGSNDYVDLGTLDIPGDKMTISAWVNADTFSHLGGRDARIVSKATGTSAAAHYWMLSTVKSGSNTVLRYRLKTNASTKTLIATSAVLTTGTWIHVAAVYDGSQMRLYQDGVEVGSTGNTGTIDQNAAVSAWIGQNPDGNRPFDGLIDDVQIHSRALSAAEIAALASGGGSGNVAPTVDAGVDQTIVLPADATLDGTVSDDGEPNPPGAVTTLWTMMSGPGTVTFGDDTAVDTTASFSVDGVYVLNLAADDSDLTSNAQLTVTVNAAGGGNVAPTVDAGVDQTIVLPADATLDGTVSDDGEPNPPGAVITLWTMMSGPGTVTFGDDTAVDTTASFSVDGVYVLNLAADDSDLTSNAQLTVTVNAAGGGNVAPTVDAGVDQTIVLPADATLDGTVSDDGEPNPPGAVTTSWTVVSGPGTVTFTDDTQVDTTASFSLEGTYELNLAANDGDLTTNDQIIIIVNAAGGSNIAPAVDAGVDQTITLPNDATLDGTISDDGEPNPPGAVTTLWTVMSGPGTVTFTDDTQVNTTASFSLDGTYELNLAANDSDLTTNDQITVIVNVAGGSGDLLGHWTLDDGSGGIASDSSGSGNNGVLTNGPIWNGSELVFDGQNDYVNLGTLDVSGAEITLTGWVQANQLENCASSDCRILSKASGTATEDHYWMLGTTKVGSATRLRFRLKANGSTKTLIASTGDLTNGDQFHVAAVYDGTTMRLYKDGIEVGSVAKTGSINTNSAVEAWIGGNPMVASARPWKGSIANIRIYQKALSVAEVNVVKNSDEVIDNTSPLISNINVSATENSATISWGTSELADSGLSYGPSSAYENGTISDGNLVLSHSITLTGLTSDTTYHYQLDSTDVGGNSSTTADLTFNTVLPGGGPDLLVFDLNGSVTTSAHGFPRNFPPNANDDWTSPVNYAEGTFQMRAEVRSQPVSQLMKMQFCVWQNSFTLENCAPIRQVQGDPGTVVIWSSSVAGMWKKNGLPIDWVNLRQVDGIAIKDVNGVPISDFNGWNWAGLDPNDVYPLDMRFTVVVVPKGQTFSGWENFIN